MTDAIFLFYRGITTLLNTMIKELQIRVDKCSVPDRVMQLNLALFPVALNNKRKSK